MPIRPLAFVTALAGGDYLLWNRSIEGNHDIVALVSGLTLAPLLIAFAWLVLACAARLLLERPQRSATGRVSASAGRRVGAPAARGRRRSSTMAGTWDEEQTPPAGKPAPSPSSGKLAA